MFLTLCEQLGREPSGSRWEVFENRGVTVFYSRLICPLNWDKLFFKSNRVILSTSSQKKIARMSYVKSQRFYWLLYVLGENHSHVKVWNLIWDLFTLYFTHKLLNLGSDNFSFQEDFYMITFTKLAHYKKLKQTGLDKYAAVCHGNQTHHPSCMIVEVSRPY